MKSIILTRPGLKSEALATGLRAAGWPVIISPVLAIAAQDFIPPSFANYQALVFTSMHGVDSFAARCKTRHLPVYAVGESTAERARQAGFTDIHVAQGNLASLTALLARAALLPDKPLLHISGDVIKGPVTVPGLKVERLIVYHAVAAQSLTKEAQDALARQDVAAVLFFSPRSAEIFKILLRRAGLEGAVSLTKALCIADSVVKSLQDLPWREIAVAQAPTTDSLAALLDQNLIQE